MIAICTKYRQQNSAYSQLGKIPLIRGVFWYTIRMRKRSELFFELILVPIDYLMILCGFALAYIVRHEQAKPLAYAIAGRSYLQVLIPLIVLWIIIYALTGLYDLKAGRSRIVEVTRIAMASAMATMVLVILDYFMPDLIFPSKAIVIYGFVFAVALVILGRLLVYKIQQYLFQYNIGTHNVVIVGNGSERIDFQRTLLAQSAYYRVVSNVSFADEGQLHRLEQIYKRSHFDDLFILEDKLPKDSIAKLIHFARSNQLQLHILPTVGELYDAPLRMSRIKNIPVLEMVATPLDGWGRIIKRLVDLVLVLISMTIVLPIMLIVALLIKLTDKGSVFYKHSRMTRAGKPIYVYKFRTMKADYCTGGKYGGKSDIEVLKTFHDPKLIQEFEQNQKLKHDPRVSKVGAFLRKTSLDELPQLFNVLKGDLSLVGPRPIVSAELERYGDHSGLFLHIKPGLTGLWQVSGRSDVSYENRVKLDIYYIENWTLGLDLLILLKTIPVFFKKGGY